MKKIIISGLSLFLLCGCASQDNRVCGSAPKSPVVDAGILNSDEYVLNETFSDEFESGGLDSKKWYDFYPTWTGREGVFHFSRGNVSVDGGRLVLTAKIPDESEVPPEMKAEGKQGYSTAEVRSKTRIRYGYFELKFKAMNALVCNAFWLNDPLDSDKKYKAGDKVWIGRKVSCENPVIPVKFADGYNVAGLLWTPEKLVWTLNGRVMREMKNENFHRPLYLNINCEVNSGAGLPEASDLPAKFEVEYVRVWQLKTDLKK